MQKKVTKEEGHTHKVITRKTKTKVAENVTIPK